VIVNILRVI